MNRQEYLRQFKDLCKKELELTRIKNADYAGAAGEDDAFANFKQIGSLFGGDKDIILVGFLTRMSDKMSRIASFVKIGRYQVKTESVEDTLADLSVYSKIMQIYLRSLSEAVREPNTLGKVSQRPEPLDPASAGQ